MGEDFAYKLRRLFLPAATLSVLLLAGYSALNWFVLSRSDFLREDVANYWLPLFIASALELGIILPRLRNAHVFYWYPVYERHPLIDGEAAWKTYIDVIRSSGKQVDFLLEFVKDDSTDQFVTDAATLKRWLAVA